MLGQTVGRNQETMATVISGDIRSTIDGDCMIE